MRLLLAFILLISVHLAMDAQVLSDSKSIPNFTGVWVWDLKKGGPMIAGLVPLQESNKSRTATNFTMTIEHNEPSMRVKSLVGVQGHETFETNALFFTDRRKVEAFGKLDSDNFRTASWHGRRLEEEIHGILQKEQTKGMDKVFKDKDTYRLKTVRTYHLSKDEKTKRRSPLPYLPLMSADFRLRSSTSLSLTVKLDSYSLCLSFFKFAFLMKLRQA